MFKESDLDGAGYMLCRFEIATMLLSTACNPVRFSLMSDGSGSYTVSTFLRSDSKDW